ncbi:hypothetical protein ACFVMC_28950 [Nocardia sp. NPDC127579]|uniref:hypothetical protein n=1 Tax=Nocardia sp. NPDC127579 TaxID=3345402 RepID=UPI003638BEF5
MRHRSYLAALALAGAVGTAAFAVTDGSPSAVGTAHAQQVPTVPLTGDDHTAALTQSRNALATAGLTLPDGWLPAWVQAAGHDQQSVTVVRYEQDARRDLGGEHITTVVGADGTLLGYTRMTASAASGPAATDRVAARTAAATWLNGFAADYAAGLDLQFVEPHEEQIRDSTGVTRTITGLKVKSHHASGLYAWTIVDGDGQVITYERDIRWDSGAGRRGTEMWMHDKWIAAREGSGPQPSSPYARA